MPNLKYFELNAVSKDVNENLLIKFIRKLLFINLDICILKIQKIISKKWFKKTYTKKELSLIFPTKNIYLFDVIYIEKIEENDYKGIDDFEFI